LVFRDDESAGLVLLQFVSVGPGGIDGVDDARWTNGRSGVVAEAATMHGLGAAKDASLLSPIFGGLLLFVALMMMKCRAFPTQ
jgi:hypothetical protein